LCEKLNDLVTRYLKYLYEVEIPVKDEEPIGHVRNVNTNKNDSFFSDFRLNPHLGANILITLTNFSKIQDNSILIEDILRNDGIIQLLKDKGVAIKPGALIYNVLHPLILRQIYIQDGVELNESGFNSKYEAFEKYLFSENDSYRLFALIDNFAMEGDKESIGPISIRRLTPEENTAYNGDVADPALRVRDPSLSIFEFVLEMNIIVPRGSPPLTQQNQDIFRWLVGIMKLIKTGSVCFNTIWVQPMSWSGMSFGGGSGSPRHSVVHKPYYLKGEDLVRLREYWSKVESYIGQSEPFWAIPLQRFCDAVDRYRSDEALIDYWIACESLFGPKEWRNKTKILSTRIGGFLGTTPEQQDEIGEIARRAYHTRGVIMHNIGELDNTRLSKEVIEMERITRLAICKCLEIGYASSEEMLKEIDSKISAAKNAN